MYIKVRKTANSKKGALLKIVNSNDRIYDSLEGLMKRLDSMFRLSHSNWPNDCCAAFLGGTRRYGLLRGPSSSSCGGLRPRFFLPFGQKRAFYTVCFAILSHFFVFSSDLSNFFLSKTKTEQQIQKKSKKSNNLKSDYKKKITKKERKKSPILLFSIFKEISL